MQHEDPRKSISAAPSFEEYLKQRDGGAAATTGGEAKAFPNLPASVHPGVVSGQAMMDLLDHAKQNGTLENTGACVQTRVDGFSHILVSDA